MSSPSINVPTDPRPDRMPAAALAIVLASVSGFLITVGFCIARRGADPD
jgi:hypothetical protein